MTAANAHSAATEIVPKGSAAFAIIVRTSAMPSARRRWLMQQLYEDRISARLESPVAEIAEGSQSPTIGPSGSGNTATGVGVWRYGNAREDYSSVDRGGCVLILPHIAAGLAIMIGAPALDYASIQRADMGPAEGNPVPGSSARSTYERIWCVRVSNPVAERPAVVVTPAPGHTISL